MDFLPDDSGPVHTPLALSQVSIHIVLVVPVPHQPTHNPPSLGFRAARCRAGRQIGPGVRNRGRLVPAGHASGHAVRHGLGQAPQRRHLLGFPAQDQLLLPLLRLQRSNLVLMGKRGINTLLFYVILVVQKKWQNRTETLLLEVHN